MQFFRTFEKIMDNKADWFLGKLPYAMVGVGFLADERKAGMVYRLVFRMRICLTIVFI